MTILSTKSNERVDRVPRDERVDRVPRDERVDRVPRKGSITDLTTSQDYPPHFSKNNFFSRFMFCKTMTHNINETRNCFPKKLQQNKNKIFIYYWYFVVNMSEPLGEPLYKRDEPM